MKKIISFKEYKSNYSFNLPNEDYFLYESHYGCSENDFLAWLRLQRLFYTKYGLGQLENALNDVCLPEKKWKFFTSHYERVTQTNYIVSSFPDGFFEAEREDGQVACLLPDTYGKERYRISYYRANGPTYHETFSERSEALKKLANGRFKAKEGALDALVHTEQWNRGLQVALWLYEGVSPFEGLQRDKHDPEIQQLFAAELAA